METKHSHKPTMQSDTDKNTTTAELEDFLNSVTRWN